MSIQTNEVKEKLTNLREYMPKQEDIIYDFGKFLADRLNPRLNPHGFNLALELTLYDIKTGRGEIPIELSGYPTQVYAGLSLYFDDIAKAVLPSEFYAEFKKVRKGMEEKIKKSK